LRETDVLARLGGDEFAIIQDSDNNQREAASALADRIIDIISSADIEAISQHRHSIGIALAPGTRDELGLMKWRIWRCIARSRLAGTDTASSTLK
jgi:GGDEF domain-containing protein